MNQPESKLETSYRKAFFSISPQIQAASYLNRGAVHSALEEHAEAFQDYQAAFALTRPYKQRRRPKKRIAPNSSMACYPSLQSA